MAGKRLIHLLFAKVFAAPEHCGNLLARTHKYEWLKPADYFSFAKYKQKIREIFNGIGTDYKIIFKELKV